ncbi:MAG: hypothetical protein HY889_09210 [Deltaproteobacteria bacterium]|nr:hypothetical protein [Deltaproteobacteria bacterium]
MRGKSGLKMVLALLALTLVFCGGCTNDQSNFLKNSKFEKWNAQPEGWRLEGDGAVVKSDPGAELKSTGTATPFLYQTFEITRRYRGSTMTLAAWVKTNVADSAVIEFSDRKGHDAKSEAHAGDGTWKLLTLTVKVPDSPGSIEFRFRNYKAGSSFIREASMSAGTEPVIGTTAGSALSASGGYRAAGYLLMTTLIVLTVIYFKRRKSVSLPNVYEVFLILLALSGVMLMAQRPLNAVLTANIAWSILIMALFARLFGKVSISPLKEACKKPFKRPGAALISASLLLGAATVNALRNGSVNEAQKMAAVAYILMLLGGASIILRMAVRKLRPAESESVLVYKTGPAGEGSHTGATMAE